MKSQPLTSHQSSAIQAGLESLTATRPVVISVQSAVEAALPSGIFTNAQIGPFYQPDFASLQQATSPVFQTATWFSQLPTSLQAAFTALEIPALQVEESVIELALTPAPTPAPTSMVTSTVGMVATDWKWF